MLGGKAFTPVSVILEPLEQLDDDAVLSGRLEDSANWEGPRAHNLIYRSKNIGKFCMLF